MKTLEIFEKRTSHLALGCDHYGTLVDEKTAMKQLDLFYQAGGNLLDTALAYGQEKDGGPSTSEVVIGNWLKANNLYGEVLVATKGCHPAKADMHQSRINEKDMMEDVYRSLDQLKTDCLDVWYFHRDNPAMSADEIIDLGSTLVEKKLVKHLGASNWTTARIERANSWAKKHAKSCFEISEIQWSLAYCTPETWGDDTLVCMTEAQRVWYEQHNMPVMCFSPQAKGLFSKLLAGQEEMLSQKARNRFLNAQNLALVPKVEKVSKELGVSPAAVVIAYLTSQKNPTIPVIGSTRIEQITETLTGSDLSLTEQQIAYLKG